MWQKSVWEMISAFELGSGGTVTCPVLFTINETKNKSKQPAVLTRTAV